jgi:hypothetical protein
MPDEQDITDILPAQALTLSGSGTHCVNTSARAAQMTCRG